MLVGIFVPPYIVWLEFKSKEELQLMPQTMEEHLDELDSQYSDNENISVSSVFDEDPVSRLIGNHSVLQTLLFSPRNNTTLTPRDSFI